MDGECFSAPRFDIDGSILGTIKSRVAAVRKQLNLLGGGSCSDANGVDRQWSADAQWMLDKLCIGEHKCASQAFKALQRSKESHGDMVDSAIGSSDVKGIDVAMAVGSTAAGARGGGLTGNLLGGVGEGGACFTMGLPGFDMVKKAKVRSRYRNRTLEAVELEVNDNRGGVSGAGSRDSVVARGVVFVIAYSFGAGCGFVFLRSNFGIKSL